MTEPNSLLEVAAVEVIKRLSVRIGELEQQAVVAAIQRDRLLTVVEDREAEIDRLKRLNSDGTAD